LNAAGATGEAIQAAKESLRTILAVEDDPLVRTLIMGTLVKGQFHVLEAGTGEAALALLESWSIDLVLLDIKLPGMDGFEVCRRIRASGRAMAVIMLSSLGARMDILRGLTVGADDYIVKPFDPEELVARVKAVLRRTHDKHDKEPLIRFKNLEIEFRSQKGFKNGKDLNLTTKEFILLVGLCSHSGRVVSRAELSSQVWGEHHYGSEKRLDVYIQRLRQKVEDNPAEPTLIRTVRGYGYIVAPR
jgi:DNA-binding response OmpR family regulator